MNKERMLLDTMDEILPRHIEWYYIQCIYPEILPKHSTERHYL